MVMVGTLSIIKRMNQLGCTRRPWFVARALALALVLGLSSRHMTTDVEISCFVELYFAIRITFAVL